MKLDEIKKHVALSDAAVNDHMEFNPLALLISDEFNKHILGEDYRKRALKRAIDAKIEFVSESNSITDMLKMFVKVVNPLTGNEMKYKTGGGNFKETSMTFIDEVTGDTFTICLEQNAMMFSPKKR